jgi:hypothetical protein
MRVKYLLLLTVIVFALAGCGGSSLLNPFIGTYNGTWTQTNPSDSGTSTFLILPGGSVSGSLHDTGANVDYTIAGTMSDAGLFHATLTPTAGSTLTINGNMVFNQSNHLVGTVTITGNGSNTLNFDMTPQ